MRLPLLPVLLATLVALAAYPLPAAAAPDGLEAVEMDALRVRMRGWNELAQAWFRLQAGDADGARRDVRALLRGNPGDPDALHLLGIAAAGSGRDIQALHALRTSLRRRPDGWVGTHLVHLLVRRGNRAAALRVARRVKTKLPADVRARRAYAYALVAAGDTEVARMELESLERDYPDAGTAHRLSLLHTELGDHEKALAAAKRAVSRDPDQGLYRLDLFRRLEAVADWPGLVAASSEAGADAVGGGRASYYRGVALARMGKTEAAVEALSSVVQHGRPDPVALAGAAGHLLQLGDYGAAEATARAAVTRRADDPRLHHLLAMALTRQAREQEAVAYYRRAAELLPADSTYRFDLLVSLCSLERRRELDEGLTRAMKDFDEDPRFPGLAERCGAP